MAALPKGLTQEDLDRYAKLDAGIKKLTAEKNELGALIKSKVTKVGTFVWGKVVVKRSQVVTPDIKALEDRFPRGDYPQYYKAETVYSLDLESLPSAEKDQYKKVVERLSVDVAK